MKLEVGKKYRTREGEVVKIIYTTTDEEYQFMGDNTYTYTPQGAYYNIDTQSTCDLVEEIKETKMKLEVGKKYRTVDGTIVTVKAYEGGSVYPFRVAYNSDSCLYTEDGFYCSSEIHHGLNIIEEIKENTMFNKDYKYLCMDADGYNKASINKPTINTDTSCWEGYDLLVQKNFFNLGDDWKESLREIVYNDDGSSYLRKPRHEFKVDDKVLVRGTGESNWKRRHFCEYTSDGLPVCFISGQTSFTTTTTSSWDEIKPYEEGE